MAPSLEVDLAIREVRAADEPETTVRSLDANPQAAPEASTVTRTLRLPTAVPQGFQPGMVLVRVPIAVRLSSEQFPPRQTAGRR